MNQLKLVSLLTFAMLFWSCTSSLNKTDKPKSFQLSDSEKQKLIAEIDEMHELDQEYRSIINVGTLDEEIIKKSKELSKTASIEEYIAFTKTYEKNLKKEQIDSLFKLQHQSDYQNYKNYKKIISKYGYPSRERLGVKTDKLFPILLHPPGQFKPQEFLEEMQELLLPEVKEKRMEAMSFAMFVDNIKAKILKEPQLYGTNKSFDPTTISMGAPEIENIEKTNSARKAIGLAPLKDGEYKLKQN